MTISHYFLFIITKKQGTKIFCFLQFILAERFLSQSRRLPPLSGGEWQQICLSGSPISDWDEHSVRMRSDSVKNMSAYADQNHAPSLATARLELQEHKFLQNKNIAGIPYHKGISAIFFNRKIHRTSLLHFLSCVHWSNHRLLVPIVLPDSSSFLKVQ